MAFKKVGILVVFLILAFLKVITTVKLLCLLWYCVQIFIFLLNIVVRILSILFTTSMFNNIINTY